MPSIEFWGMSILAVIFAALIGFVIGRKKAPGGEDEVKNLMQEYEMQLSQKQAELEQYQQQVHAHYDKTAGLFKNMAGSYKDLFDHLSKGYEQLGNYSDKRVLPERAGALLDGPDLEASKDVNFMHPDQPDEDALNR